MWPSLKLLPVGWLYLQVRSIKWQLLPCSASLFQICLSQVLITNQELSFKLKSRLLLMTSCNHSMQTYSKGLEFTYIGYIGSALLEVCSSMCVLSIMEECHDLHFAFSSFAVCRDMNLFSLASVKLSAAASRVTTCAHILSGRWQRMSPCHERPRQAQAIARSLYSDLYTHHVVMHPSEQQKLRICLSLAGGTLRAP